MRKLLCKMNISIKTFTSDLPLAALSRVFTGGGGEGRGGEKEEGRRRGRRRGGGEEEKKEENRKYK